MAEYALHQRRIDAFNFDYLHSTRQTLHDAHRRRRHPEFCGEETDARLIRLPVHRRRLQPQLICVSHLFRQRRLLRARLHFHGEARPGFRFIHVTSARRLATPATDFASTTSNAIASSTQSWLEPSAFCVATVSVYACGVSQQSKLNWVSNSSPGANSPRSTCSSRVLVP